MLAAWERAALKDAELYLVGPWLLADTKRGELPPNTVHIGPTAFLGLGVVDNNGRGARVARVVGDGPAAAAGISVGDIIYSVDSGAINGATSMTDALIAQDGLLPCDAA